VAEIELTNYGKALVDDSDVERVGGGWFSWRDPKKQTSYVTRNVKLPDGSLGREYLHRVVLGLGYEDPRQADHENGNGQDCRKRNLRIATYSENNRNRKVHRDNFLGVKGIRKLSCGSFQSRIALDKVQVGLGTYWSLEEAMFAYNYASTKVHGEFGQKIPLEEDFLPESVKRRIQTVVDRKILRLTVSSVGG